MRKVRVHFSLPRELFDRVEKARKRSGPSRSEFCERAIEAYLRQQSSSS